MESINYDLIGRALIHPAQAAILMYFAENGGQASPKELTEHIDAQLATVSYHVRLLAGLDCGKQKSPYANTPLLKLADTAQRRGAVQHFYALTKAALR
jgi:hypothetical protein